MHGWISGLIRCQEIRAMHFPSIMIAARTEYCIMAGMVVANVPILYILNRDWYQALVGTVAGKLVLGICGMTILITTLMMLRFTKPIEYRWKGR